MKGECYWKSDKPVWTLYQYHTDSTDGDIAWRILHNTTTAISVEEEEKGRLPMVRLC
jgi:hypothetical protein